MGVKMLTINLDAQSPPSVQEVGVNRPFVGEE
jgi:hypothetical protein